jgi:hypothetical protein
VSNSDLVGRTPSALLALMEDWFTRLVERFGVTL